VPPKKQSYIQVNQKALAKNNRSDTSLPCFMIGKLQEEKIRNIFEKFCSVRPKHYYQQEAS